MADETFEMFVAREGARLDGEREAIFTQQQELESRLTEINRELSAIDAYEAAKSGKALPGRASQQRTRRARYGSRREQLLQIIKESYGLTRGEILEKMGLKGNKSGEMSVSNALTALTKGSQVARRDGRYVAV